MAGSSVILLWLNLATELTGSEVPTTQSPVVLNEILAARGLISAGYNSLRMAVELNGGNMVEVTNFEPDPCTHRSEYYYNSGQNRLYRRIFTDNRPAEGVIAAYWKSVSQS